MRRFRLSFLAAPLALAVRTAVARCSTARRPAGRPQGGFGGGFGQMEARALAEPFKGVTTNGTVTPGLYSIRSTGVSTEPVVRAANAFIAALTPEQRAKTQFAVDDDEWRKWANVHLYPRQGVSFDEMGAAAESRRARIARGVAERQGSEAERGHHASQRDAGRAQRQQLRRVRRGQVLPHGHGHAVGARSRGAGSSTAIT